MPIFMSGVWILAEGLRTPNVEEVNVEMMNYREWILAMGL